MKSAVIVYPGSNCDRDAATAIERVTGHAPEMVWHGESALPEGLDFIMAPGGFSYGDYLRCGAIAARSPITADLIKQAEAGVPILGVCNGFQILIEAGLLPGALMRNEGLHFVCERAPLLVETANTRFTSAYGDMTAIISPMTRRWTGSKAKARSCFATAPIRTAQPATSPASRTRRAMCWG